MNTGVHVHDDAPSLPLPQFDKTNTKYCPNAAPNEPVPSIIPVTVASALPSPLTLPPRSAAIAEDIMFAGPPRRNPVIGIIIINKCIDGVPKNGTNAPEDNSNMTTTTGALELYLSLIQPAKNPPRICP